MIKARLDTFGNDFGQFRIFESFLSFLEFFEDSTLHGTLGKHLSRKNCPKTCSKHVSTLLGTIFGIYWILNFFDFFENFRRLDHPRNTGRIFFFVKIAPKHVQGKFGHFAISGNDFRHFWFLKSFLIFRKFSKTPWNTMQKSFFKKIAPKQVENTFEYFCERFCAFLDFWIFSKTRTSMEHWGNFFFRKKCPKTRLETWERFWTILELWNLLDFFLEFFLSIYIDF